jgi:hypothetical protein
MHQDSIPKKGQIWQHFKGNKYSILGVARTDEDYLFNSSATIPDYWAKDTEDGTIYAVSWIDDELLLSKAPAAEDLFHHEYVIYQDLKDSSKIWAREINNFKSSVTIDELFKQERFQLVGFQNEPASIKPSEKTVSPIIN